MLPQWREQMDPILVQRIERSQRMDAQSFERAQQRRTQLWLTVQRFFERYDVLVTPVTAVAPFSIDVQYPTRIAGRDVTSPVAWFPFTFPFAITGQPAISVPCGWTAEGLPVGLQIVGGRHADATVLKVAAAFEAAHPWTDRRSAL
jgi:Asp-tRNA(Asn)/Glu-tRNA(Gln) amidotransferase A subunit family amidase